MSLVIPAPAGSISVPDSTLVAIAVAAAERLDGVRVLRRRSIDPEGQVVRLALAVRRGEPLAERGAAAQAEVARLLETMCGLRPRVEITIAELA